MNTNDGGPAFPGTFTDYKDGESFNAYCPGMSLRDYIAVAVLKAILTGENSWLQNPGLFTPTCYRFADALLAEREKHGE